MDRVPTDRRAFLRATLLGAASAVLAPGSTRSRTIEASFFSPALGAERQAMIHLPPFSGGTDADLPILYVLHGLGDDEEFWRARGILETTCAMWEAGEIPPMAIAIPDGRRGFYTNAWDGGPREADLVCPDFVRWTEERLLGPRSRARRAIAGISMGGYGAVKIALAHPGEFVAAASLSGSFTLPGAFFDDGGRREELLRSIFGPPGDERMRDEADVHRLASCLDPDAAPELYLACGTADRYGFHDGALALHRTLASRGIGSCLVLDEGGHDVRYWRRALPPMLRFVGACFGWRAPAGAPDAKR